MENTLPITAMTIAAACMAFATWVAITAYGRDRGLVFWAAGLALHAVLYGLVSSHPLLAPFTVVVVANVVLSATLALMTACVCHLRHCSPSHWLIWIPVVLVGVGFYAWQDNATWRVLVGGVIFSAQCVWVLVVLWQKRLDPKGRDLWALSTVLFFVAMVYALRVVAGGTQSPALLALVSEGPIQTSTPLMFSLSVMWVLIGFELLLHSDDSHPSQG